MLVSKQRQSCQTASKWEKVIWPVSCRVCDAGVLPAAEGSILPVLNHFVLAKRATEAAVDAPIETVNMVREYMSRRSMLRQDSSSRGDVAAHYARLGFDIYFSAAQGDCAPDSIALELGFGSTPVVWKQVRAAVADSMFDLRHTEWFRECFQACQEFDDAVDGAPFEAFAPTRHTDDEQDVNIVPSDGEEKHESMNCEGQSCC